MYEWSPTCRKCIRSRESSLLKKEEKQPLSPAPPPTPVLTGRFTPCRPAAAQGAWPCSSAWNRLSQLPRMLPCQALNTPVSADEIPKEGRFPSSWGCCLWKSMLLIHNSAGVKPRHLGCSAFCLALSEAGRSCQVHTGPPLCFSFVTLNGTRVPVLSDVCASTCWGRFAVLCQDPAGQGASFCSGWTHGPAPRGLLHMCPLSLCCGFGMWKQGQGERGLLVCLPSSRGQILWSCRDGLQVQVVPQAGSSNTAVPHSSSACLY